MINVLYVNFASRNFDGSVYSLMDLIRSVKGHVAPIVLLRSRGCVYDFFTHEGIECIVCDFEEDLVGIPQKWHQYVRFILDYIPHRIRYRRRNRKCVEFIASHLQNRDIHIVHINNTVMSVGKDIALALGAKCVWHLRGFMDLDFGWMPLRGWRAYKTDLMNTDAVIGITKTVLEHFMSLTQPNAYVFSDAVRSVNDVCEISVKEKYFLFCSAFLTKNKGCDFAVDAFIKSKLADQGFQLIIIGKGDDKFATNLKKVVEKSEYAHAIEFVGLTDNVKRYMERATALLMCSLNEGLGRVSVEAMFYGCLVIGRNSGGTKDFIIDHKTGFLFDDIQGCVNAMKKASESCNLDIISYAQKYACDNFSIEHYGSKILKLYESLTNQSSQQQIV